MNDDLDARIRSSLRRGYAMLIMEKGGKVQCSIRGYAIGEGDTVLQAVDAALKTGPGSNPDNPSNPKGTEPPKA